MSNAWRSYHHASFPFASWHFRGGVANVCDDCKPGTDVILWFRDQTVVIKNPEFGDGSNILAPIALSTMMDGMQRTRRAAETPTKLTLTFAEVSRVKSLELRDFLTVSAGQFVKLLDLQSRWWRGKVTNAPTAIATLSRGGGSSIRKESSTIDVTFEGMLA